MSSQKYFTEIMSWMRDILVSAQSAKCQWLYPFHQVGGNDGRGRLKKRHCNEFGLKAQLN